MYSHSAGSSGSPYSATQQASVAPAFDPEVPRRGDPAVDEILRDRQEVVVRPLAVLLLGRLPPVRSELPTAADVGHRQDPAAFEPRLAGDLSVPGGHRNLEPSVAV